MSYQCEVALQDLIQAVLNENEKPFSFLCLETGQVLSYDERDRKLAESDIFESDLSPTEKRRVILLRDFLANTEQFLPVPDRSEIQPLEFMEDFASTVDDAALQSELLHSLRSKNPQKRFQDTVQRIGLFPLWQKYYHDALADYFQEWCEEIGVSIRG